MLRARSVAKPATLSLSLFLLVSLSLSSLPANMATHCLVGPGLACFPASSRKSKKARDAFVFLLLFLLLLHFVFVVRFVLSFVLVVRRRRLRHKASALFDQHI